MSSALDKITQITIYLKDSKNSAERVHEVAFFHPIHSKASLDAAHQALRARKWTYKRDLTLPERFFLKIQSFFFQNLPQFISDERKTGVAKFKTALALLLIQENVRDFFLGSEEKKTRFFSAIEKAARALNIEEFKSIHITGSSLNIAQALTYVPWKQISLIDDEAELNLQVALFTKEERDAILLELLNNIERPPIVSVLETSLEDKKIDIEITTKYAKCQVLSIDKTSGAVHFSYQENHATSSIETMKNIAPETKGVMNQRMVFDTTVKPQEQLIGSYSGALATPFNVLEQILFVIQEGKSAHISLLETLPSVQKTEEKWILFTSLYSWNELDRIQSQHEAIYALHDKILEIVKESGERRYIRLKLFHQNLAFNMLSKFPTPAETKAVLNDLNDEMLISLTYKVWQRLNLVPIFPLEDLAKTLDQQKKQKDYLKRQKAILELIDRFHVILPELIAALDQATQKAEHREMAVSMRSLLLKNKKLAAMDVLIYTSLLMKGLGILHNQNCEHSTERSASADAADKAQNAFGKITGYSFLPSLSAEKDVELFKVLYSMYFVWEEPELNAALNAGAIGEKVFSNPEIARYLK